MLNNTHHHHWTSYYYESCLQLAIVHFGIEKRPKIRSVFTQNAHWSAHLLGGSHFAFDTSSLRNLITHPRRQIDIELLMIIGIYSDEASIKLALIFLKITQRYYSTWYYKGSHICILFRNKRFVFNKMFQRKTWRKPHVVFFKFLKTTLLLWSLKF